MRVNKPTVLPLSAGNSLRASIDSGVPFAVEFCGLPMLGVRRFPFCRGGFESDHRSCNTPSTRGLDWISAAGRGVAHLPTTSFRLCVERFSIPLPQHYARAAAVTSHWKRFAVSTPANSLADGGDQVRRPHAKVAFLNSTCSGLWEILNLKSPRFSCPHHIL